MQTVSPSLRLETADQQYRLEDFGPFAEPLDLHTSDVSPPNVVTLCEQTRHPAVRRLGETALAEGRVGVAIVAGGLGTRLGFPHPKGMLPVCPLTNRTLFQILIEKLLAVRKTYGVPIPLYLMTSPATHHETATFLQQHSNFGLPSADLRIFRQGTLPAFDADSQKPLRTPTGDVLQYPDGHGGFLAAMRQSGQFADMAERGIDLLFYGQVDNPLLPMADAVSIGWHLHRRSDMTTLVVRRRSADERVGVFVRDENHLRVVEYSELPEPLGAKSAADGRLTFWAGNTGMHVISLSFLKTVAATFHALPIHRQLKEVSLTDSQREADGMSRKIIKLERFLFDLLSHTSDSLLVEVDQAAAFAPIKNGSHEIGDTLIEAQQALIRSTIFQTHNLFEFLTVSHNVELAFDLHPDIPPTRIRDEHD